jgi:hypothetical protein
MALSIGLVLVTQPSAAATTTVRHACLVYAVSLSSQSPGLGSALSLCDARRAAAGQVTCVVVLRSAWRSFQQTAFLSTKVSAGPDPPKFDGRDDPVSYQFIGRHYQAGASAGRLSSNFNRQRTLSRPPPPFAALRPAKTCGNDDRRGP